MLRRLLAALRERFRQSEEQPPPEPGEPDTATLGAIVIVLLSELRPDEASDRIEPLLARLGVSREATRAASDLLLPHIEPPSLARTPALRYTARTEVARQAAYLVNAARRLTVDPNVERERRFLAQHLEASRRRREAATRVDAAAVRFGPQLGWYAIRDSRTTSECRRAHGSNFPAHRPPVIGYPGSLHGGTCRCVPGPRHRGGRLVDEVVAPQPNGA